MNILRLHLHIESIHANGSDDQRGVEALSARSSSSFLEVTWRLQESYAVGLLQPPDTVVLSCLFQYGILFVFTAFSGPMAAALPVREHTSSAASFSRCLEHCNYVLWRNIRQDIVNRLKHEPATRSPNRYELAHIHSPGPNQKFRVARVCRVSQPLLQKVT